MEFITWFFEVNQLPILFIYGLVFFLMGFAIFIRATLETQVTLTRHLKILGLFGIIHAFADWGLMFLPIQKEFLPANIYLSLESIRHLLTGVSFFILFIFGVNLLTDSRIIKKKQKYIIRKIPYLIFLLWLLAGAIIYNIITDSYVWLAVMDALDRYFIAFPAALIAAIAFYFQINEFAKKSLNKLLPYLYLFIFSFSLYALTQLFPGPAPFQPASWINTNTFYDFTGVPVYFFRWISAVGMTVAVLKILSIFDIDYLERVKESERIKVLLNERNRIARELHDNVIQTIYGLGLHLQKLKLMKDKDFSTIPQELDIISNKVNDTILEIRSYILDLKDFNKESDLIELLEETINEFASDFSGKITFNYSNNSHFDFLANKDVQNIISIVKLAINNAIMHGNPSEIKVTFNNKEDALYFSIEDNGKGFEGEKFTDNFIENLPLEKQGLRNIKFRTEMLRGNFEIKSEPDHFFSVNVIVPKERK